MNLHEHIRGECRNTCIGVTHVYFFRAVMLHADMCEVVLLKLSIAGCTVTLSYALHCVAVDRDELIVLRAIIHTYNGRLIAMLSYSYD